LAPETSHSIIAAMQIAKTAQMKAAFHHGSTVPYGIAVATISKSKRVKIALLNKTVSRKGAKAQRRTQRR